MKVKKLLEILQKAVDRGCGDINLEYDVPCLYISEDSDIYRNEYRGRTESLNITLKELLEAKKEGCDSISVGGWEYDECSCWDYYDDRKEEESEEDEDEDND